MIIYKIKRRRDGLFSTGGSSPTFTKKGKVWTSRGAVTSHLNLVNNIWYWYRDCDLVEYEVVEKQMTSQTLEQVIAEQKQKAEERQKTREEVWAEQKRLRRLAEYEELKKEFGWPFAPIVV